MVLNKKLLLLSALKQSQYSSSLRRQETIGSFVRLKLDANNFVLENICHLKYSSSTENFEVIHLWVQTPRVFINL